MSSAFYVLKEFDDELLEDLPELYKMIERESHLKDGMVSIIINSPGGHVVVLEAYLAAIVKAKSQGVIVNTIITGEAASCASILAINGTVGYRQMSSNSYHYIHWGKTYARATTPEEADRYKAQMDRHFEWVKSQYQRNAKIPALARKLQSDSLFVNPEQCVEWKLVDEVLG